MKKLYKVSELINIYGNTLVDSFRSTDEAKRASMSINNSATRLCWHSDCLRIINNLKNSKKDNPLDNTLTRVKQIAKAYNVPVNVVNQWENIKDFPKKVKVTKGRKAYIKRDVDEWVDNMFKKRNAITFSDLLGTQNNDSVFTCSVAANYLAISDQKLRRLTKCKVENKDGILQIYDLEGNQAWLKSDLDNWIKARIES